jgi:hypothetical protein
VWPAGAGLGAAAANHFRLGLGRLWPGCDRAQAQAQSIATTICYFNIFQYFIAFITWLCVIVLIFLGFFHF